MAKKRTEDKYLYRTTGCCWEFEGIDRLLSERRITSAFYESSPRWRTYRILKKDLHLLPHDENGEPYLASINNIDAGWGLYEDEFVEKTRVEYGAEWVDIQHKTDA